MPDQYDKLSDLILDTSALPPKQEEEPTGIQKALNAVRAFMRKPLTDYEGLPGVVVGGSDPAAKGKSAKQYLEEYATPGLHTSPAEARMHGFSTGALEAINPEFAANTILHLMSGGLGGASSAVKAFKNVANTALGAVGAADAFDDNLSTLDRVKGGLQTALPFLQVYKDNFSGPSPTKPTTPTTRAPSIEAPGRGPKTWSPVADKVPIPDKLLPPSAKNFSEKQLVDAAAVARTEAAQVGSRLAKARVAQVKQSLAQGAADTRPTDTSSARPLEPVRVETEPPPTDTASATRGRFAVTNREQSAFKPIVAPGEVAATGLPEPPSEATQAALAKTGNSKMAQQRVNAARQAAAREMADETKLNVEEGKAAVKAQAEAVKAEAKAAEEAAAQAKIQEAMDRGDLEPTKTVSERFQEDIPGGKRTLVTKYLPKEAPEPGAIPFDETEPPAGSGPHPRNPNAGTSVFRTGSEPIPPDASGSFLSKLFGERLPEESIAPELRRSTPGQLPLNDLPEGEFEESPIARLLANAGKEEPPAIPQETQGTVPVRLGAKSETQAITERAMADQLRPKPARVRTHKAQAAPPTPPTPEATTTPTTVAEAEPVPTKPKSGLRVAPPDVPATPEPVVSTSPEAPAQPGAQAEGQPKQTAAQRKNAAKAAKRAEAAANEPASSHPAVLPPEKLSQLSPEQAGPYYGKLKELQAQQKLSPLKEGYIAEKDVRAAGANAARLEEARINAKMGRGEALTPEETVKQQAYEDRITRQIHANLEAKVQQRGIESLDPLEKLTYQKLLQERTASAAAKQASTVAASPEMQPADSIHLDPDQLMKDTAELIRQKPEVASQLSPAVLDKLKSFIKGESGAADPYLAIRLGLGAGAGAVGYKYDPVGQATGGDQALLSALLMGGAGVFAPELARSFKAVGPRIEGSNEQINNVMDTLNAVHNTGLLSPLSVVKKAAGDIGGLGSAILESSFTDPRRAGRIMKALTSGLPSAYKAAKAGWNEPTTEAISGLANIPQRLHDSPLGWNGRMMQALTRGTKDILNQAGFTPEEQAYYTLTANPTGTGKHLYNFINSTKVGQHFSPFARIGLNRLQRGVERSPLGLVQLLMNPEEGQAAKIAQQAILGSIIMGGASSATPDGFFKDHPREAALISAMAGPYGIPVLAGMAMKGRKGVSGSEMMRAVTKDVPGFRFMEDVMSPEGFARNYLSSYTNVTRPIAEAFDPADRRKLFSLTDPREVDVRPKHDAIGSVIDQAIANIPGARNLMPSKTLPLHFKTQLPPHIILD